MITRSRYKIGSKQVSIWILLLGILFNQVQLPAQQNNIGTPFTRNYSSKTYDAGTQNWEIHQYHNGLMLFANNNGLLQFDGSSWKIFPLENKTIARSVFCHQDGKIYVGGQNEFGYFATDHNGHLVFHSLTHLIPEPYQSFEDVWEILSLDQLIFFRASQRIYQLNGNHCEVFTFENNIDFMGSADGRLFIHETEKGISEWRDGRFQYMPSTRSLAGYTITSIFSAAARGPGKTLLLTTLKNGIFQFGEAGLQRWQSTNDDFLKTNRIYAALAYPDGRVVLGTTTAGLLILDQEGRFLYHLNRKNGLQNNNILSLFADKAQNLWLGLDNGIDYVQVNSAFTKIIPNPDLEGAGYTTAIYDDNIYFGTSDGLYVRPWSNYSDPLAAQGKGFEMILQGQVWRLDVLNNQLLAGHHEGIFTLNRGGSLSRLSEQGSWVFLPLEKEKALAGTYFGLSAIKAQNDQWLKVEQLDGFSESSRFVEAGEAGIYWVAHPYRGIYRITLDEDRDKILGVKLYNEKDGLPSDNLNHVFKINQELVFTGATGVFRYDAASDRFTVHQQLLALLGEHNSIQRFFEDKSGNIWFVSNNGIGRLLLNDKGIAKSFTKQIFAELNGQLLRGFEMIYPYDRNNVFIGAEKGFIHFNPSRARDTYLQLTTLIHEVRVISTARDQEEIKFSQAFTSIESELSFSHLHNAFSFGFSAPYFQLPYQIEYQTRLLDQEEVWSDWSDKTDKEYNNLIPGDYTFQVRAKNRRGEISKPASFSFTIRAPWYATTTARFIYGLIILSLVVGLIVIPRMRYKVSTEQLKSEHQKLVKQSEQEINELKNKNLQAQILHHKKELASTTMHLVQKSELIQKLRSQLQSISRQTRDPSTARAIKDLDKLLNPDEQLNDNWSQFAYHFDQVHSDFLKRLREAYPQLSANDYKLCTYLRMNLSTKEIAPLMNISIRGVEVGRYRLRKKLALDSRVNLNRFMMNF